MILLSNYYHFGKKQFEYELRGLCIRDRLGFLNEITDELLAEGNEIWEKVYAISTINKSVDIIIYSSIDMRTNYVRDVGADAVRVVMRWKTKHGMLYKKLAKHYRLKTLFSNLRGTLLKGKEELFSLNGKDFVKDLNSILD
jgi:hypothetical protein